MAGYEARGTSTPRRRSHMGVRALLADRLGRNAIVMKVTSFVTGRGARLRQQPC
jgi:hypothetical protein